MEQLLARHRKEQRELQGKITSKKKNATKKTRKGVNDECDRLERDLKEQQQAEIKALAPGSVEQDVSNLELSGDVDQATPEDVDEYKTKDVVQNQEIADSAPSQNGINQDAQSAGRKPNRHKERLARRAAEREAQMEAATQEAAQMPDQRQQELSSMKLQMESRNLVETLIRPDGHCLYSACAHTLPLNETPDYKTVRTATADYIDAHPDDFAPFMEESVDSYTRKIKDTAEWGGHLELQAIAKAFKVIINVLQANGHVERIEPNSTTEQEIWLAYYRHSFGLGEHYNALQKLTTS